MQQVVEVTQRWLWQVIVKYNICPFARQEIEAQRINYQVCKATAVEDILATVVAECKFLDEHPEVATALVIVPDALADFSDYLDTLDLANQLLRLEGYEGVFQLASFHPAYCFAGEPEDDPANYTNRAPYPIFHILREDELAEVLDNFDQPELIPERNIAFARRKGAAFFERLLHKIKAGEPPADNT